MCIYLYSPVFAPPKQFSNILHITRRHRARIPLYYSVAHQRCVTGWCLLFASGTVATHVEDFDFISISRLSSGCLSQALSLYPLSLFPRVYFMLYENILQIGCKFRLVCCVWWTFYKACLDPFGYARVNMFHCFADRTLS